MTLDDPTVMAEPWPERAGREGDSQPLPTVNDRPDIQSQVIADIAARRQVGISRYGTALQPHNGRNALLDLYEELLDACCYIRQRLVEDADARLEVEAWQRCAHQWKDRCDELEAKLGEAERRVGLLEINRIREQHNIA